MVRTVWVLALAAVLACGAARADDLKVGEPFKGEVTRKLEIPFWPGFVDTFSAYGTEVPVKLVEGHKYTFTVSVKGEGRKVSVAVADPSGKILKASPRNTAVGSASVTYEEASLTGTFRVVVMSDGIGGFTLNSSGPTPTDVTAKALEEEIAELKALLAKKEAALKAVKAKKP